MSRFIKLYPRAQDWLVLQTIWSVLARRAPGVKAASQSQGFVGGAGLSQHSGGGAFPNTGGERIEVGSAQ